MMHSLAIFATSITPAVSALLFKVTVLLCVANALVLLMRRFSAAQRHFVWFVTLSSVLALSILQPFAPTIGVHVARDSIFGAMSSRQTQRVSTATISSSNDQLNNAKTDGATAPVSEQRKGPPQIQRSNVSGNSAYTPQLPDAPNRVEVVGTGADGASSSEKTPDCLHSAGVIPNAAAMPPCALNAQRTSTELPIGAIVALIWVFGSLVVLVRVLAGHVRLASVTRSARVVNNTEWLLDVKSISRQLGARRIRVLMHGAVDAPFTTGWLRPVIVLPGCAETYTTDRRRAVLLHEAAHVARRDYLALCVAMSACSLFWFHPAVWIAARCMRNEGERAADDCVVTSGMSALEYATHLLALADRTLPAARTSVALGMAHVSQLELRLRAMLDMKRSRIALSGSVARATALMSMMALVPLAALRTEVGTTAVAGHDSPTHGTTTTIVRTASRVNHALNGLDNGLVAYSKEYASAAHKTLPPRGFPVVTTTGAAPVQRDYTLSLPTPAAANFADSVFEKTIATSDSVAVAIDMDVIGTLTPHWWDEDSVKVRVVNGTLPLHVTFELHGDSAVVGAVSSDGTMGMSGKSGIDVWVPRRGRIVEHTTTPGGWRIRVHGMSSMRITPKDTASEKARVFQSQSVRARVDTSFEQTLGAVSGQRLALNLPAGGAVIVHGWDQPTARLVTRIEGKYEATTHVTFEPTRQGIELRAVSSDSSLHFARPAGWSMTSAGPPTFFGSPYVGNHFELWVPRRTNISLSSAGGAFTVSDVDGDFSGETADGPIVIQRAHGDAKLATSVGDVHVASSVLSGSINTGCGNISLGNVAGGLQALSNNGTIVENASFDTDPLVYVYGVLTSAPRYCRQSATAKR